MGSISNEQVDSFSLLGECFFRAIEREKFSPEGKDGANLVAAQGVIENIVLQADGFLDVRADSFGSTLEVVHSVLSQCVSSLEAAELPNSSKFVQSASLARDAYQPI